MQRPGRSAGRQHDERVTRTQQKAGGRRDPRAPGLPAPATAVLALQRTAGNAALQRVLGDELERGRTVDRRPTPGEHGPDREIAVQRDVGFEFEIAKLISTKWSGRMERRLKKKERIFRGAHFAIEADGTDGNGAAAVNSNWTDWYSNIEFVTKAFSMDKKGFGELARTLDDINQIGKVLNQPNTKVSAGDLPCGKGTWGANIYTRPSSEGFLAGQPQATVGLHLAALDQFLKEIRKGAKRGNAKTVMGDGLAPGKAGAIDNSVAAPGLAKVGRARKAVATELRRQANQHQIPQLVGADVRAFLTQIVMYLVEGFLGVPGYGKTIGGPFMQRTDFATTFQQMSTQAKNYFTANPDEFVRIARDCAQRAAGQPPQGKPGWNASDAVFSGGLYNHTLLYGHSDKYQADLLPELTRTAWLKAILTGTDLLTAVNYPAQPQNRKVQQAEIESLGSYGNKMDTLAVPGAAATNLPLVELRGLPGLALGVFPALAMDIFQYVQILNSAGAGMPGNLLGLSVSDRADLLVMDGDDALAQLLQTAAAAINHWT